jgi:hypothetical protein
MTADQVLAEIQRRYWRLQRLPGGSETTVRCHSAAYLRLEAEIRELSEQYTAMTRVDHSQYREPLATASAA